MNEKNPDVYVDHINSNLCDNTKANLRLSNAQKNPQNRKKQANTTSKYLGVLYDKNKKLWTTRVVKDGKILVCKTFDDEISCARFRDLYILDKLPDEHYKLNFDWSSEDKIKWKEQLDNTKLTNKLINKKNPNGTSTYLGVFHNTETKKWVSRIHYKGKPIFYTSELSEDDVTIKRDLFILSNNLQETFKLNFEWTEQEIEDWTAQLNFVPKKVTLPQA
jgi:hypothetical protein